MKSQLEKHIKLGNTKKGDQVIKIISQYNWRDVELIKSIKGAKYHIKSNCWTVPLQLKTIQKLQKLNFIADKNLFPFIKQQIKENEIVIADNSIKHFNGKLYPYQEVGVGFIEKQKGRALIADEMGLGKTIQSLAWLALHPELRPAVIIVPASLKIKWAREAKKWVKKCQPEIISTTSQYQLTGDILIINPNILKSWNVYLKSIKPKVIVIDEVHYYKNGKAQRTGALKELCKNIPHVIGLSGTPIENKPIDIYNVCQIINPTSLPDWWTFIKKYCDAKLTAFGWDYSGASNTKELYYLLAQTIMIRRKKKDVLKELPEITTSYIPIEINNKKEYKQAEDDFLKYIGIKIDKQIKDLKSHLKKTQMNVQFDEDELKESKLSKVKNAEALVKLSVLKQLTIKGKLPGIIEWIKEFFEVEDKLIVFCIHTAVITELMNVFGKVCVKVDGSYSIIQKQKSIDSFQNDPKIKLIVLNFEAGGTGIDLVAASNVAIIELPDTPGKIDQAIARAHRIGQKADKITAWYLLAEDTIEERIMPILDNKRQIIDSVLDGQDTENKFLLEELVKSYKI